MSFKERLLYKTIPHFCGAILFIVSYFIDKPSKQIAPFLWVFASILIVLGIAYLFSDKLN